MPERTSSPEPQASHADASGERRDPFLASASLKELMTRGMIEEVFVEAEFLKLVEGARPLTIYFGLDPTSPNLHLGHLVSLRILRWFQLHGHRVIFLIGDFTGRIGDPTDKSATRKTLSHDEVLNNARTYEEQAGMILDFGGDNPVEIKFNSEWLDQLTFRDIIELASKVTVQQMLERDMFRERMRQNKPVSLHEFLYPLMQGYDSVEMSVDVELGGRDQLFNMMVGRDLVRALQERSKHVITTPLLPGLDGRKMGKTEGNTVDLTAKPAAMYQKLTQIKDGLLPEFLAILSDAPDSEINEVKERLDRGETNLMDAREKFAFHVVERLHGERSAEEARAEFRRVVVQQELPSEIEVAELAVPAEGLDLVAILIEAGRADSRSQARRLVKQNAVRLNDERKTDSEEVFTLEQLTETLLRVGKQPILRLNPLTRQAES